MKVWEIHQFSINVGNVRFLFVNRPTRMDIDQAFGKFCEKSEGTLALVKMREKLLESRPREVEVIEN